MGVWEEYTDAKKRLIDLIISTPPTRLKFVGRAIGKTYTTASTIADHLLASGVIVPPCKIGETVYIAIKKTSRHCKAYAYVRKSKLTYKNMARVISDFGKTVFLSYEEAERVANEKQ